MLEYQKTGQYFAQTQRGLETVALEELQELGAKECQTSFCGVYFKADTPVLYAINYRSAIVSHVLAPLTSFSCGTEEQLYKTARRFPWHNLFTLNNTFAVKANVSGSQITHSRYAALKLKDAIVDYFRDAFGQRPSVDAVNPQVRLNLNIRDNRAVISLDTSGESLHRRGYRVDTVAAPMQETLAAAIIRLSGWVGDLPLMDPMCGSGTLLAEAMISYCRIPPAFKRKATDFGFIHLPGYDKSAWRKVKAEADEMIRPLPEGLIYGSDIDKSAVKATRRNLNQLPQGKQIPIEKKDFDSIGDMYYHTIVTNPPYGVRIGEKEQLKVLYRRFGDFLKQHCNGTTAFILCGDKELSKNIGLKVSQRIPLYNGPLDARLIKVEVY